MKLTLELNRDHIRGALTFAAVADVRYYLNGILVEAYPSSTFIVATDGTRVGIFKSEATTDVPAQGVQFIIAGDQAKTVKAFKALATVVVTYDTETKDVTIADFGGATITAKAVDGRFPDWRRIVPTSANGESAHFDVKLVAELAKLAKVFGRKTSSIHIHSNGEGAAPVSMLDTPEFVGVLMPMRIKSGLLPAVKPSSWTAPCNAVEEMA